MNYQIEWRKETEDEFKAFSKKFRKTIKRKVEHIAANIPNSLKLRSVQPVKEQDTIDVKGSLYELDIGYGAKAGLQIDDEKRLLVVYMVGTHEYAISNYLKLASERLKGDDRKT